MYLETNTSRSSGPPWPLPPLRGEHLWTASTTLLQTPWFPHGWLNYMWFARMKGESSIVPMSPCPVGIGSLTLRTDTSFTLGPLEGTRVSIYLDLFAHAIAQLSIKVGSMSCQNPHRCYIVYVQDNKYDPRYSFLPSMITIRYNMSLSLLLHPPWCSHFHVKLLGLRTSAKIFANPFHSLHDTGMLFHLWRDCQDLSSRKQQIKFSSHWMVRHHLSANNPHL